METDGDRNLNPWFSIWTKPRQTIQQIVDSNPDRLVLLLAAIAGISGSLDQLAARHSGDRYDLPIIFAMAAIAGPISGIIGLYIGGAVLRWTGTWIGGEALSKNIRAAMAWSSVPIIWLSLLWIPEVALFGDELFKSETPLIDSSETLLFSFIGFGLVEVVVATWGFVVFLKCLGQVQRFSAWKALGNSLISALVIVIPLVVIAMGIGAVST